MAWDWFIKGLRRSGYVLFGRIEKKKDRKRRELPKRRKSRMQRGREGRDRV